MLCMAYRHVSIATCVLRKVDVELKDDVCMSGNEKGGWVGG